VVAGAAASVDSVAAGAEVGAFVGALVGAFVGAFVGAAGVLAGVGATYGAPPDPLLLEPLEVEVWLPLDVDGWLLGCEPLLWLPLLWLPVLCSVVGWWCEPPLVCGFLVGFLVGLGGGAWVGGGAGGGAAVVGCTVGVAWVGSAAAGERFATSPDPEALCGHQATRHADRPSNAATAKRTTFVQVLLTTSSLAP
jgi:hypothetical protein